MWFLLQALIFFAVMASNIVGLPRLLHYRQTDAVSPDVWQPSHSVPRRPGAGRPFFVSAPCKNHGAKSDRKQLARLIGHLSKDDVLVATRLDRLARSTKDLLNLLGAVADNGAGFKSLRDTWADTTTPHGRLMLTVLGGLAEFERELICSRTSEGRKRAKAKGVVMGRKPKLTHHQRQEAIARREAGESLVDIGRS